MRDRSSLCLILKINGKILLKKTKFQLEIKDRVQIEVSIQIILDQIYIQQSLNMKGIFYPYNKN